jgi:spermidine synthase
MGSIARTISLVIPWQELGRASVPTGDLVLARRGDEYAIRLRGAELMNSRAHASEELLATLGCAGLTKRSQVRVLIGGLGMGFTTRAALGALAPDACVEVVELLPEIVAWNRGPLAHLADHPLDDPRVEVIVADVADRMRDATAAYHAILLDVDNGPDAFTTPTNAALYGVRGLERARRALVPGGVLGVWSVADDRGFTGRLRGVGFSVEQHRVPARAHSGARHVVWIARAP